MLRKFLAPIKTCRQFLDQDDNQHSAESDARRRQYLDCDGQWRDQ
jgi:hypothetical protein